jgi:hypothetical protein
MLRIPVLGVEKGLGRSAVICCCPVKEEALNYVAMGFGGRRALVASHV